MSIVYADTLFQYPRDASSLQWSSSIEEIAVSGGSFLIDLYSRPFSWTFVFIWREADPDSIILSIKRHIGTELDRIQHYPRPENKGVAVGPWVGQEEGGFM